MAVLELAEEVTKKHNPLDRLDDFPEILYASGYGEDPNQMSTDPDYLMTVNFTLQDCPGGELIDDREAVCAEEKAQNVCAVSFCLSSECRLLCLKSAQVMKQNSG
jgi:hypothetical protein